MFDLFGVNFKGHPDQRRILMWDEFEGHPMRTGLYRTIRLRVGAHTSQRNPGETSKRESHRLSTAAAPNYELIQQDGLETNLLEVSMGPHHPSTHGVFRMDVKLDGETVVDLRPVFGYLHRNHEKLAENMSYLSSMPFTDRLDYFNSMSQQLGLRSGGGEAHRGRGARARRIPARHHGRADAAG